MPVTPWLVPLKVSANAVGALFCFHYAGGSASVFRDWRDALPAPLDLYAVQMPGRERRFGEVLPAHIHDVLESLYAALLPHLSRPACLFGYSLGALLAFEIAQRMQVRLGRPPVQLIAAAARAPHIKRSDTSTASLTDAEFVQRLREYQGTSEEVLSDPGLMNVFLPVIRSDFRLAESYLWRERAPLRCPVTAIGGTSDEWVTEQDVLAWSRLTEGSFSHHMLDGGHFFLHQQRSRLLQLVGHIALRAVMPNAPARALDQRFPSRGRSSPAGILGDFDSVHRHD